MGWLRKLLLPSEREETWLALACGICLFMGEDHPVEDAVTIINGQAVCTDHIYLVRDNAFLRRVDFAKGERP
jgi:hypothetical protein